MTAQRNADMQKAGWSVADMPPQVGRRAIVTGTGGLGYETALALAGKGADVILAGRNEAKGAEAIDHIRRHHPGTQIAFSRLDLADLASVAAFADRISAQWDRVDLLINNAGVMTPPKRLETKDGFELQFGTNYLGHFALTAWLLPLLRQGRQPRIVQLSSLAHRTGRIRFDDLQWQRYRPWPAYSQSKLAMLIFTLELQHRSEAAGWGIMSNAAHPGYARTELIANGPGNDRLVSRIGRLLLEPKLSHSAAAGALPTLYAATASTAIGGGYYGPGGFFELIGQPHPARIAAKAHDRRAAAELWRVSEKLTGTRLVT